METVENTTTGAAGAQRPDGGGEGGYAAFISYRHTEADRRWAKWLHNALETYRVPRKLARERGLPRRVGRCFRDEEELPASADLSREIESALARSRFLIVVCSPRTPGSEWVNREIERFREMGRDDRILALLVEGEPADSFPRALREIRRTVTDREGLSRRQIEQVEPLAADVRPTRHERRGHLGRMAKLRLLACVLGVTFDDLRQREQERRARALAAVGAVLACLLVVVGGLGAWALVQRGEAVRQRGEAVRLAGEARRNAEAAGANAGRAAAKEAEATTNAALATRRLADANRNLSQIFLEKAKVAHRRQLHLDEDLFLTTALTHDDTPATRDKISAVRRAGITRAWVAPAAGAVDYRRLSGDGRRLITWGDAVDRTNSIRLWDVAAGAERRVLLNARYELTVAVDPGLTTVAAAEYRGRVRVVDVETGRVRLDVTMPETAGPRVALSPDGRWLAAGGENEVGLWELPGPQAAASRPASRPAAAAARADAGGWANPTRRFALAGSLAFSADGRRLVGAADKRVAVADVGTGAVVRAFDTSRRAAVSPDGVRVVVPSRADGLVLLDLASDRVTPLGPPEAAAAGVDEARFSRDGRRLVVEDNGRVTRAWDVGRPDRPLIEYSGAGTDTVVTPTGAHVAFLANGVGAGGTAHVLDVDAGEGAEFTLPLPPTFSRAPLAIAPDGKHFYVALKGPDRRRIIECESATGKVRDLAVGTTERFLDLVELDVSRDGKTLLVKLGANTLWAHDLTTNTGRELEPLGPGADVAALAAAPGGAEVASGGKDGAVRVWDAATGRKRWSAGGGAAIKAVAWPASPVGAAGSVVVAVDAAGAVHRWDAATGRRVGGAATLPGVGADDDGREGDAVDAARLSADGRRAAYAAGGKVMVVGLGDQAGGAAGKAAATTPVADGRLVGFGADGRYVAVADEDGFARLLELEDPEPADAGAERPAAADGGALGAAPDGPPATRPAVAAARRARPVHIPAKLVPGLVATGPGGLVVVAGPAGIFAGREGIGEFAKLNAARGKVEAVAISPDGFRVAAAVVEEATGPYDPTDDASSTLDDGAVYVWDLRRPERSTGNYYSLACVRRYGRETPALAFRPDGGALFVGGYGGMEAVALGPGWEAQLKGHEFQVTGGQFSADGAALTTVDRSGQLVRWDVATGRATEAQQTLPRSTDPGLSGWGLGAAGKVVWRADRGDDTLDVFDTRTGERRRGTRPADADGEFTDVWMSADGSRLYFCTYGAVARSRAYDARDLDAPPVEFPGLVLGTSADGGVVLALVADRPAGDAEAATPATAPTTTSAAGGLAVFDAKGRPLARIAGAVGPGAVSADGALVAGFDSADGGTSLAVWSVPDVRRLARFDRRVFDAGAGGSPVSPGQVLFASDKSAVLAVSDEDHYFTFWRFALPGTAGGDGSRPLVSRFPAPPTAVGLAVDPTGRRLATWERANSFMDRQDPELRLLDPAAAAAPHAATPADLLAAAEARSRLRLIDGTPLPAERAGELPAPDDPGGPDGPQPAAPR